MSIEEMKQVWEALHCIESPLEVREIVKVGKAMGIMRKAIEEAEKQEPVAWVEVKEGGVSYATYHDAASKLPNDIRFDLYTRPPKREWVSLTDFEIDQIYCDHHDNNGDPISLGYERALEAKLWEKNKC